MPYRILRSSIRFLQAQSKSQPSLRAEDIRCRGKILAWLNKAHAKNYHKIILV